MNLTYFPCCLFFVFCSFTIIKDVYGKKHGWDYLQFSQSWPQAFCSSNKCNYPTSFKLWNIHGLWPKATKGESPVYCFNASRFDLNNLKPIMTQLNEVWINLKDAKHNKKQWHHEWLAHGSCTEGSKLVKNQLTYFNISIEIKKQYNITKVLNDNSIHPSNSQPLQKSKLSSLFEKAFGKSVMLRCQKLAIGQIVLSEVRVCFDRSLAHINCPNKSLHRYNLDLEYVFKGDDATIPCPQQFLFLEKSVKIDYGKGFDENVL